MSSATTPDSSTRAPTALVDLNVLVALAWPQHVHHERAIRWFSALDGRSWATTPVTESGFVRLSMNAAVVGMTIPAAQALDLVRRFGELPGHVFLPDRARLAEPGFDVGRLATSRQVTDFHLLAVARATGSVLATMDRAVPTFLGDADRYLVELLP